MYSNLKTSQIKRWVVNRRRGGIAARECREEGVDDPGSAEDEQQAQPDKCENRQT
jgi:hypothetical protein